MNDPGPVHEAVARAHREHWATVLAATIRLTRDLDLAEDCVQDAFARAMTTWSQTGVPQRPVGWLITVAGNRARDLLRRESRWRRVMPELVIENQPDPFPGLDPLGDDQLRLIFICCHPALPSDAQIALTLRLVCGLSTAEVARAFLVRETAMAARITRAKKKIATARIPYRIPGGDDLHPRVSAVLEVLHQVFTTGHLAPFGDQLIRADLIDSAIRQTRLLHRFLPRDPAITGLLALMLLTDARRAARTSDDLVLLTDQDRSLWDRTMIAEGVALAVEALSTRPTARYAVEAAIVAVHAEAASWEQTDWVEIAGLYDVLAELAPSPVVALNRAVAIGMRDGPAAGLAEADPLRDEPALATYGYLSAARADFLRQLGRRREAREAYQEALALTGNRVEQNFLQRRLEELDQS